jgi:TRAP-type C4-dicarboxylate transport system permease small subunit
MQRSDIVALLVALGVTGLLVWGLVYFVQELWPVLPPALALIIFILLAVIVIGYPIYALARLSDRYLARQKKNRDK